jgi:hypothetical protein
MAGLAQKKGEAHLNKELKHVAHAVVRDGNRLNFLHDCICMHLPVHNLIKFAYLQA